MNSTKLYMPDHEKWTNYYKNLLAERLEKSDSGKKIYKADNFLVPSETSVSQNVNKSPSTEQLAVKLISPVKRTNDQVVSELRREEEESDIKGISMKGRKHKRSKKTGRNTITPKRKKVVKKRNKKRRNRKKSVRDIFTL